MRVRVRVRIRVRARVRFTRAEVAVGDLVGKIVDLAPIGIHRRGKLGQVAPG